MRARLDSMSKQKKEVIMPSLKVDKANPWGVILVLGLCLGAATAQTCPARPGAGSIVVNPTNVYSSNNGVLNVSLTANTFLQSGFVMYCYAYPANGTEAPTLRPSPGDSLALSLTNDMQEFFVRAGQHMHPVSLPSFANPDCDGYMASYSTNVHFHGLSLPPLCRQDETIFTLINPGDPPFLYKTQIPANQPPGLYWYHPHPHGMTQAQVMGGASGALIIQGIDKVKPEVAGLTEQVLVLRDQSGPTGGLMTTVNFVPAASPYPVIQTGPSEKQFWRVLNAEGETFVRLQVQINGQPQKVEIVALDGTPLATNIITEQVDVPPAGRAEFIMQGPPEGATGTLVTLGVNTGPDGTSNPPEVFADIVPTGGAIAKKPLAVSPLAHAAVEQRFSGLAKLTATTQRSLYFSEYLSPDPGDSQFYITVQGQTPQVFEPTEPPAIVTQVGAVEDWTIENQAHEIHAFHIHQLHFLLMQRNGVNVTQEMLDTVAIPAWSGTGPYPNVTLRMDFSDPQTAGTFLYHCHILMHEDQGMMGKIEVLPTAIAP